MLAVHIEDQKVTVGQTRRPRRAAGHALLRLIEGGICNTDIELMRGYYGFRGRPGHEFVAEVVEANTPALIGRRVVGEINLACGHCDWCARGLGRHCPRRTVLGIVRHPGAFAEYLTLPEKNLHAVPDDVPTSHAVFTEPIAAACEILDQVTIPTGGRVAVLGDGKLGLLIGQVLRVSGAAVVLFGRHRSKLRIAERAGVGTELAKKRPPRKAFDWVVEATGSAAGLAAAVAMTRPRGTVILKSTVHTAVAFDTAPVVVDEIHLVGSRCGRFEPALELLREKRLLLDELISDRYPLGDAPRAFARAAEPGVLKVLLENRR
jgi:alcohol dehydrogenase